MASQRNNVSQKRNEQFNGVIYMKKLKRNEMDANEYELFQVKTNQ